MKNNKNIALLLSILLAFSASIAAFGANSVVQTENLAGVPVVDPLEATTFTGIAIELTLAGRDDDDDLVLYQITQAPRLGQVELDGSVLRYTPATKTGTDKFSYTAVDAQGNTAIPATIHIQVKRNKGQITSYADLEGNPCHYAALQLAASGIMRGEKIADCSFFHPNDTISRSEFVLMVSELCGFDIKNVTTTGFLDDEGLSGWAKPYISTAVEAGLVSGYPVSEAGVVMRGENPITVGEASAIVQNVLRAADDTALYPVWQEHSESLSWDVQAVSALQQMEVLPTTLAHVDPSTQLTRQDASILLLNVLEAI